MLTKNEKKVLRYITANYNSYPSINKIAKDCKLTPNGAYKILRKFEKENILKFKKISNIKAYHLDFENIKTKNIMELAFMPDEIKGRISYRIEDLKPLKTLTKICALFGSYIIKEKANDLDVLFVLERKNYGKYKDKLREIKPILPTKLHDMVQTRQDLIENIKNGNKIIPTILEKGIFLWGYDELVNILEKCQLKKN